MVKAKIGAGSVNLVLQLDHLESLKPQTPAEAVVRIRPGVIGLRGPIDIAIERLSLVDSVGRKYPLVNQRYWRAEGGTGYEANLTYGLPDGVARAEFTLVMTKAPRTIAVDMPFVVRDVAWLEKKPN